MSCPRLRDTRHAPSIHALSSPWPRSVNGRCARIPPRTPTSPLPSTHNSRPCAPLGRWQARPHSEKGSNLAPSICVSLHLRPHYPHLARILHLYFPLFASQIRSDLPSLLSPLSACLTLGHNHRLTSPPIHMSTPVRPPPSPHLGGRCPPHHRLLSGNPRSS